MIVNLFFLPSHMRFSQAKLFCKAELPTPYFAIKPKLFEKLPSVLPTYKEQASTTAELKIFLMNNVQAVCMNTWYFDQAEFNGDEKQIKGSVKA